MRPFGKGLARVCCPGPWVEGLAGRRLPLTAKLEPAGQELLLAAQVVLEIGPTYVWGYRVIDRGDVTSLLDQWDKRAQMGIDGFRSLRQDTLVNSAPQSQ